MKGKLRNSTVNKTLLDFSPFARAIKIDEVKAAISRHEVIAEYSEDQPYPSRLLLGFSGKRPLHVVLGYNLKIKTAYVVTAYQPNLKQWEPDFKRRRT